LFLWDDVWFVLGGLRSSIKEPVKSGKGPEKKSEAYQSMSAIQSFKHLVFSLSNICYSVFRSSGMLHALVATNGSEKFARHAIIIFQGYA